MKLKSVKEIPENTTVILRMDLDLPIENGIILDNQRLVKSLPTIKLLLEKKCQIAIIGHRGRPIGIDDALSLKPVYVELMSLLETNGNFGMESVFLDDPGDTVKLELALENQIIFLENLRFWPEEEEGESDKLRKLLPNFKIFVNDAFAVAHRKAASVMMYQQMPGYYGLSFIEEAEKIGKLLNNPQRPLTVVLGGAKADKLSYVPELLKIADKVLIGGKLPKLIQNPSPASQDLPLTGEPKIIVANLRDDGMDLSNEDIEKFKETINNSKTIVWAGAMGKYEDKNCKKGTEEIARAIANNPGYKIIAGGDTGASVVDLGLNDKIDFVCSGGGVTLEYLTKGTLPAWE